ncbi:MAG: cyclic nucleotide-binding domain-containing protein [Deltaproteobacteria bacterium]|nr:MAG: cyclic nucleotide-binding domain-containing protein [Deltaproteobacteria bacterium]
MAELHSEKHFHASAQANEPARKLCEYLLAAGVCDEPAVVYALERQENLRAKGYDPLVGMLLLDAGAITKKDLTQALKLQDIDRLANSAIFQSLPKSVIAKIHSKSERLTYNPNEIIFRQQEGSNYVYVILLGTVSLSHKPEKGKEVDLAVHRAGEVFGEMSLLTESPRFVTAKAMENCSILAVPRDVFLDLYREYPQASQAAIRKWFNAMLEGHEQSQVYQEHHYSRLLTKLETRPCIPLIGSSKRARNLRDKVDAFCGSNHPVLLSGDHGSMKSRVAQFIHKHSEEQNGSYIIFDPAHIPEFVAEGLRHEKDTVYYRELEQMAALFGYDQVTYGHTYAPWQGYLKLAHNGTLVIREGAELEPKVQRLLLEYLKTGMYYPLGAERPAQASARIIIDITDDLNLENTLYEYLVADQLRLEPLRNRKRDLKEIIHLLLRAIGQEQNKPVKMIDQEALNRMMAYNWPGNFDELEEVVSRSISLAKGDVITAEDVFIGTVPITGKKAFNLLSLNFIRNFFQSPFYPIAPQVVVASMFVLVVILGVWGNPSPDSNISLLLIWANWEPLLILSCLLLARIWCSFCPIGFFSNLVRKVKLKRMKIPPQYLNYGFFISAVGLAIIFWAQAAFHMFERPTETAWLLLAMLGSAVLFALLFEGRIWCRYVCPLGQMVATFARASIVEVRSNYNYCSHECTDYVCYTGSGDTPGCSMGKGPFAMDTNQDCVLCGNCMKACKNQAVRFNLRPPGWELWNARAADLAMILFVPLLWGTQIFRGLDLTVVPMKLNYYVGSMELSYAILMGLSALFAYHVAVAGVAFMGMVDTEAGKGFGSTFFMVMLPLVYANEIAIRLVPLMNHAADFFVILGNQVGYSFPHIAFRLDMQSIYILQIILIIVGFFLSVTVASRLVAMLPPEKKAPAFFRHLPLVVMAIVSVLLF